MNLTLIKISKYGNTFSMLNNEVLLVDELEKIRNGFYKQEILKCRKLVIEGNILEYKTAKKQLPALTFTGIFDGAHKKDNLKVHSKIIVIDIDHIDSDISIIKKRLSNDKHVISTWLSPSGNGLKALIHVDADPIQHRSAFDQILNYFKQNHNVDIDKSGSDLCRLCYVSYDEDLKINENYEPFLVSSEVDLINPINKSTKSIILSENTSKEPKLNSHYNKRLFIRMQKFLQNRKLSITAQYDDWYKVALALSTAFSPDLSKRYFLQLSASDENYDEYKCLELLNYCYKHKREGGITFRTIVHMVTNKGFVE